MVLLKRFILMIQFLTTIPIPLSLNVTEKDFGKGLVFAPVVGVLIGGILAGAYCGLKFVFPVQVAAVLLVVLYMVLTGGLHLDGLGDSFDGLFSNRPKERILEIMRDSRVGTNAVLAIVSVLFLDVSLLSAVDGGRIMEALVLMPVAGRIGSLVGAGSTVYARSGQGLGKSFIDYCGLKEIVLGLPLYFVIFFVVGGIPALLASLFPPLTALLLAKFLSRKIGGATGDILGAVCELNQTLFLAVFYLVGYLFV